MVREDWISIGVKKEMVQKIDDFLKTKEAKKLKINSRQQTVSLILREFFDKDITDSDNIQNSKYKQLEHKIDEKFSEVVKILPDIMAGMGTIKTQDKESLERRKRNILKNLLNSQSVPEHIKKELSKNQK